MRRRLQFDKIVHAKIKQYIIISRFIALQSRFENAHWRSQFFLIFCSVALALSLFLCTSFDRLCVEAFSLDFDVYTMTPPNRAVFHASWNSMLFFLVERHESVARWCFFWPTIWCRYPKRAAHEFADPQYILFWTTDLVFEENCNQVTEIEITSTTFKQYKTPAINVC